MEVLYLTEADVQQLLSMEMALAALEDALRHWAEGKSVNQPRSRLHVPGGVVLHYMAAADYACGYLGMKLYTSTPTATRFLLPLFRADSGELVALLEADRLGCLRTGAATGVATKYMARTDATRVGIIGTGHQAPTQLEAVAAVRPIARVRAYSRNPERRETFARTMCQQLGVPVEAVDAAEKAVRDADIVITVTNAKQPVIQGAWLAPGTHLNAVGANFPQRRELDAAAVTRAARIVVDSKVQAQQEAGDLIALFQTDAQRWQAIYELHQVVSGAVPGRTSADEITLFKSNGIALEDVAVAACVYLAAREKNLGRWLPMWMP